VRDRVRKAMEKALIDIDGQLWGKTYVPDSFVEKFADYLIQLKELSDEEIIEIWGCAEYSIDHDYDGAIKFARAILKKASEK
jgi:hypothetical protein